MSAARPADEEPESDARRTGWAAPINALGEFIRAQRRLSLREMAALTSVSNAYLSQVERGLQPSLKVLRSIADALQLSTEQLLIQAGWVRGAARPGAGERYGEGHPDRPETHPGPAHRAAGRLPQLRRWSLTRAVTVSRGHRRPGIRRLRQLSISSRPAPCRDRR